MKLIGLQLGKLDAAIEDCNKAIELDPDYLKAYMRRAKWYAAVHIRAYSRFSASKFNCSFLIVITWS